MKYSAHGLLALVLGASCSNGEAIRNEASLSQDRGLPEQYRPVSAAASACGLPTNAVATDTHRSPPNNLVVRPEYDNSSAQMNERKECLRRWAAANNYVFILPETGNVE
jgi:hypothetical protein